MTPARVHPFDIDVIRSITSEPAWVRARECLRLGPVQALGWEWPGGALVATGFVRDPSGSRFWPQLEWDGQELSGSCTCSTAEPPVCPHALAVAIHLTRVNPWRQASPSGWQATLDLAVPSPPVASGDVVFIYRVELRNQPGDTLARLRLKLSRARLGRRGLGQETPYPASRLKGLALDTLPPLERNLISWLLPLQGWSSSRGYNYTADPRYLDVPGPLVDAVFKTLDRLPMCFLGDSNDVPLSISQVPFYFGLAAEATRGGGLRLSGRMTASASGDADEAAAELHPEALVGEHPTYALVAGAFHRVLHLDNPELWTLTRDGDVVVPYRDLPVFLASYAPALKSQGILSARELSAAIPEVLTDCRPHPLLTLEEEEGRLVALLSFRYAPDLVVPAGSPRDVEELEMRGRRLLLHRDRIEEERLEALLVQQGLTRAAPGRLEATGEPALAFLLEHLPSLMRDGWTVEGEARLSHYRVSRRPLRVRGAIISGVDWFELELQGTHFDEPVSMSEIFHAWQEGKRFVRFGDGQHALLPADWLSHNRALMTMLMGEAQPASQTTQPDSSAPEREPGNEKKRFRLSRHLAPLVEGLWSSEAEITADDGWYEFLDGLRSFGGIRPVAIPAGLNAELRGYQHKGIEWLCFLRDHGLGGILADDMGLGKTLQALALLLIERARAAGPITSLVVAPTSVLFNWEAEARRFSPELKVAVLHGPDRHARLQGGEHYDLLVTSYALVRRDLSLHEAYEYHYVILDEAQWVKNPDSQTAAAVRALRGRHRLTLTGTPIENRLAELWSQFAFLMPGLFPDLRRFSADYVAPIERDRNTERLGELRRRIYPFVLRRLKEEVASELPPRTDNVLYCELDGSQRRLYQAVLRASRERVQRAIEERGVGRARITALDALLRLRQICCHPGLVHLPEALGVERSAKLELFRETILEILSEDHRVLVFSQFVEMLTVLKQTLEEAGVTYEYLDGRTRDRQARVDRFNAGSTPVFLISLKAGGTGLNLATADYVIHYDPWWNPAVEDQATDRAYRIGQTRPVFAYKLIARDTVEEKILTLQARKRDLADGLLSSEGGIEKSLSPEDLNYLFEELEADG